MGKAEKRRDVPVSLKGLSMRKQVLLDKSKGNANGLTEIRLRRPWLQGFCRVVSEACGRGREAMLQRVVSCKQRLGKRNQLTGWRTGLCSGCGHRRIGHSRNGSEPRAHAAMPINAKASEAGCVGSQPSVPMIEQASRSPGALKF